MRSPKSRWDEVSEYQRNLLTFTKEWASYDRATDLVEQGKLFNTAECESTKKIH